MSRSARSLVSNAQRSGLSTTYARAIAGGTASAAVAATRQQRQRLERGGIRPQSAWATVVGTAKSLVGDLPSSSGSNGTPSSAIRASPPSSPSSSSSVSAGEKAASKPRPIVRDPLELVGQELSSLRSNVSNLLGSGHPSLDTIAKYYFQAEGKHIRPLIVLLMAKATNGLSPNWNAVLARSQLSPDSQATKAIEGDMGIDEPLSPREVLNDFNPHMESIEGLLGPTPPTSSHTTQQRIVSSDNDANHVPILATQRRLAEITEMIHVASLLHDDVIDASSLRRGEPSAPAAFGNKLSILGGDFLLGRASVALARLRDNEVVELLATVIANLVEGEVMQLRAQSGNESSAAPSKSAFSSFWQQQEQATPAQKKTASAGGPTEAMFEHYMQKTYLKTAALIGKSARASVILGGSSTSSSSSSQTPSPPNGSNVSVKDAAYSYGRNVGMAFQLIDDVLDFKSTSAAFGKPSGGADLRLGLATAPVLFAWQEIGHELGELVQRKFEGAGDVERALDLVQNRSTGLQRTEELAKQHVQLAIEALHTLPWTEARDGLQGLAEQVISRIK